MLSARVAPLVLVILDGWGLAPPGPGNAISQAKTPTMDRLWLSYPHTQLVSFGESVGLPPGEPGDSETGHLNLGAGRIVYRDLPRINRAIADGSFSQNPAFTKAFDYVRTHESSLHLIGLIGPGGIHSSLEHLYALLWLVKQQGLPRVYLDLFTDGRDAPPSSAANYLTQIEERLKELGVGKISTVAGRYYGMDRDNRWERSKLAYEAITEGKGLKASSAVGAVTESYKEGRSDEFVLPTVITDSAGIPVGTLRSGDGVICFNFRPDRMRQLVKLLVLKDLAKVVADRRFYDPFTSKYGTANKPAEVVVPPDLRSIFLNDLLVVTMTEYERGLPVSVAFPAANVEMPFARVVSEHGLRQLHISETEKYPHVTYFFNGGREVPYPGETVIEIPSPKVATYDQKPEMAMLQMADELLHILAGKTYTFAVVNFAGPDMVGHTGVLPAAVRSCEVTDEALGKIVKQVVWLGGTVIITADHGNAEEMINRSTGEVDTEHNANPVPFIAVSNSLVGQGRMLPRGILADVAPTMLKLLDLPVPLAMTGRNLLG